MGKIFQDASVHSDPESFHERHHVTSGHEPGRTFFPLFSCTGSPWGRVILALSPGPGSSHASWNCPTEFCSPNLEPSGLWESSWFLYLTGVVWLPLGAQEATLTDWSAPDLGTLFNVGMGGRVCVETERRGNPWLRSDLQTKLWEKHLKVDQKGSSWGDYCYPKDLIYNSSFFLFRTRFEIFTKTMNDKVISPVWRTL